MIVYPGKYSGNILIPTSKSDSQRAILAAGLAKGKSILNNIGSSADELNMLQNIREIGADVSQKDNSVSIQGTNNFPSKLAVNVGESGLGCRLITSILITQKGNFEVVGEGTLITRPMTFFKSNFETKIPKIEDNDGLLPIQIEGPFNGGKLTVNGSQSSQYISGLLMALPLANGDSELYVQELNSKPYVQMTLDTISKFGIEIVQHNLEHFLIRGNQKYLPTEYTIESDWSSASYWLVASALGNRISVQGLNPSSLQADKAILKAFAMANCVVEFRENRIFIDGKSRKSFSFDATDCPDLYPSLAVLAALTPGTSSIFGLSRLLDKESNRALTIQTEFKKLGVIVQLDIENNVMLIEGKEKVQGGRVFSNHDHRIAMSLAILGMNTENPIEIENAEAVKKSYPGFWKDLIGLR